MGDPSVNGVPDLKLPPQQPVFADLKAAGPFPWRDILVGIFAVLAPIVVKWVGAALAAPTKPDVPGDQPPPP